jgi:hypothetical protein
MMFGHYGDPEWCSSYIHLHQLILDGEIAEYIKLRTEFYQQEKDRKQAVLLVSREEKIKQIQEELKKLQSMN